MRYGFIGLGNMGGAIVKGILSGDSFSDDEVYGYDVDSVKAEQLYEEAGVSLCGSIQDLAGHSDVIILAVKPQYMQSVLDELKPLDIDGCLIISIAAGLQTEYFEKELKDNGVRIVRAMPNLNASYHDAIVGICGGSDAVEADIETAERIFASVGTTVRIDEHHFPVFSAIAGASPAFTFMYADALAMAAVKAGIPRATAYQIAAAAIRGSGTTLMKSNEHPDALRDKVCSPGGTTIEGVTVLEQNSFKGMIIDAVDAVIEKDKKLGK